MKRLVLATSLLVATACGGEDPIATAPLGLDIRGIAPESLGYVQIVVLAPAQNHVCNTVRANCLATVPDADFVPIRTGEREQRALRVPITASAFDAEGQRIEVRVPQGTNYMFVAQALSSDGTALLGAGCEVVANVVEGDNPPVLVQVRELTPEPTCNPSLD